MRAPPVPKAACVLVGTTDPTVQTRPFIPSFTPDGRLIIVPNFRADNVSIVELARAVKGDPGAEVARIPVTRPKQYCPAAEGLGRHVRRPLRSDLRRAAGNSRPQRYRMVIDLKKRAVVATVTGVGNDPYGLAVVETHDHD